ncbi:unnamed protein product [Trichobilharzia szidati]|nr:unnamed protein product [Trichobilharzia szidati]
MSASNIRNLSTKKPHKKTTIEYSEQCFPGIYGTLQFYDTLTPDEQMGALKAFIYAQISRYTLYHGCIGERHSFLLLTTTKVVDCLTQTCLPYLNIRGIHSAKFYAISNYRSLMSVDLYIEKFLPDFLRVLSSEKYKNNYPMMKLSQMFDIMLKPLFDESQKRICTIKNRSVINFTQSYRNMFATRTELLSTHGRVPWDVHSENTSTALSSTLKGSKINPI